MKQRAGGKWILHATIGLLCVAALRPGVTHAGSLDFAADYLNRQQGNITSGISHTVFFKVQTPLPGASNSIRIVFPISAGATWCRVGGADLQAVGLTDPQGVTESATPLPGTLAASCVPGNGSTTYDTITVSNIGALVAGVKYGVVITDPNLAKLGTPPPAGSIQETLTTNNGTVDVDSLLFYAATVPSDQLTIAATVVASPPTNTNPTVEFRGVAAANGEVTITRDNLVVSSVPTDTEAAFDVTLSDQPVGQHVYVIQGVDRNHAALTSLTFALNLSSGGTSIISGVFLGPSITIDKTQVKLGQMVTVSGYTVPASSVTVSVSSVQAYAYTVNADPTGFWSKIINTQEIGVGSHTAKARSFLGGSAISEYSSLVSFAVDAPGQFDGKKPSDLNADSHVNVVDFSIMLYFWGQRNPANSRADINGDGIVDVIDFSILLYQWTG